MSKGNRNRTKAARTSDKPDAAPLLPVVIDTAQARSRLEEAPRVPIFELDGKVYDMAGAERADVALAYLDMVNAGDDDAAAFYLLTETLGAEAYEALKGVVGLSGKEFEGVVKRVQRIALPKGKRPEAHNARR